MPLLVIKSSRALVSELEGCEYGAYEDCLDRRKRGEMEPGDELTIVEILSRHTSHIILETPAEADLLFYAVCSGTFQVQHYRAACRIADLTKPHASPETMKQWRYPYGG